MQLGLTATPKRDDNVDTYAYFGEPVYVYSLKEGINDGFLTPFKVKQCRSSGNDNCKVVVWFKTCGAYASSKKYYGYGYGASKSAATSAALEMCGQNSCKVVIAECE